MKKIFVFIVAVMLIASMTVTTHAATQKLDIPDIEIPDISGSVKVELPDSVLDNWFKEHPIKIDFSKIKLWG
jgi:hypothetical protein